ncbi:Transmembrane 9 superfamily member [Aphelenchoides fujianensis]|nr:Transmembrane 9 superfamily member [Aphelenchoides fujianensis]
MRRALCWATLFVLLSGSCVGFYVPGVAPKEFKQGDPIEVKAIKLTSTRTIVPFEYYSLPFCKPEHNAIHYKSENLGEVMRGDRIVNTPFDVAMRKDVTCSGLCPTNKLETTLTAEQSDLLRRRISEDYHLATRSPETKEVFFDHGYRLGWAEKKGKDEKVFLNTHLEIVLRYHEPASEPLPSVQPRSIAHGATTFKDGKGCEIKDGAERQELVAGQENKIVWTYSVRWESSSVPWASRWDVYLKMKDVQIHWFSIINSLVVLACLSGFVSVILIRTIRRDIERFNRSEDLSNWNRQEDALDESGWKLVHADVFRPPPNAMLLVNLCGTGIQLLLMVFITIVFAAFGMLSPSSRGSLMSVAIVLYCLCGVIAGYHSGRLAKTLRVDQPRKCALRTALLFPGLILGTGFLLNFFLIAKGSSGAVPLGTMVALAFLWLCVDLPLVFIGHHFGYRKEKYQHPVRSNQIPRQIPEKPAYLKAVPCSLIAGILPFGAIFIELYFLMTSLYENQFYYLFGILMIVLVISLAICAEVALITVYFLLSAEDYKWHWKSFIISTGSAFYASLLGALMALTFAILTGSVGFIASYIFVVKIYGAVKID